MLPALPQPPAFQSNSPRLNTRLSRLFRHDRGQWTHHSQRKAYNPLNILDICIYFVSLQYIKAWDLTHLLSFISTMDTKESPIIVLSLVS